MVPCKSSLANQWRGEIGMSVAVEVTDAYRMQICDIYGLAGIANLKKQQLGCQSCHDTVPISQIPIQYSGKVLIQAYVPHPLTTQSSLPCSPISFILRFT